ncbi:hypothetical protein C8J57DRAFT_1295223 [Mycena rebaudengoi]|nr:hypothetical protein C8J57DRAFT_1295223 [Mycena rebaudengoi]
MPKPSGSQGFSATSIQHATIAASTLKQLGQISKLPYVQVLSGVSLLILETVQNVKRNKDACFAMVGQIDELLCIIIDLCMETAVSLPPPILHSLGSLAETLQKIEAYMRAQEDRGRMMRFFRQQEDSAQLEDCKMGLRQALGVFSVQSSLSNTTRLAESRVNAERRHHQLLGLLAEKSYESDETSSILSSASTSVSQLRSLRSSLSSFSLLLPVVPHIFHGRQSELANIVSILLQDEAYVAILGPGGIGKTSLARAALHHPDVSAKFPHRYFLSCESAATVDDLMATVAATLDLEPSNKPLPGIIKCLSDKQTCLLVFDNFETPWEPTESRAQVENFLALLADIPQLALLMTLRGQERPFKIRWTRPFLPPLKPLTDTAAYQTFQEIADVDAEDEVHVRKLLALAGNMPLAITLMANVAAYDGCEAILRRWESENISLLPRMTSCPGALELLSLLSLFPDGATEADLMSSSCPIPDLPRCKTTLLRTALAYTESDRLKMLAPVRQFIRVSHPPSTELFQSIRRYWSELLLLWTTYEMPSGALIPRLTSNVGNIASVLTYGVGNGGPNLKELVYDIFHLHFFVARIYGYTIPLMENIGLLIDRVDDNQLRGFYISLHFTGRGPNIEAVDAPVLMAQGVKYFRLAGDLVGEAKLHFAIINHYERLGDMKTALLHAELGLALAEQANDNAGRHRALCHMANIKNCMGYFREGLVLAQKAQHFAGNYQKETEAMMAEAIAWVGLGHFTRGIDICRRERQMVQASGLAGSADELGILDFEADIHLDKTQYSEARQLFETILQLTSTERFVLYHTNTLVCIVSLDMLLGVFDAQEDPPADLGTARRIFSSRSYSRGIPVCDRILADFYVRKGRTSEARELYEKCVAVARGTNATAMGASLRKLGDITLGLDELQSTTRWATVFLAYAKSTGNVPLVSWAFLALGNIFLRQRDDESAQTLFRVALDEFTRMDIHRGKGECMVGLADIAKRRGDQVLQMSHLAEAELMFEKSGMRTRIVPKGSRK